MTNFARTTVFTSDDIRAIADDAGSFFFTPGTMRVFQSRLPEGVFPAASNGERPNDAVSGAVFFFVTSEKHGDDAPRHYAVRRLELESVRDDRASVDIMTAGDEYFSTAREARRAAEAFAAGN